MPRLLDLFCGAGAGAIGYAQAGFDVVGVDIAPQAHYPFEFHQADAVTYPLSGFDAIHASPPCQHYTRYRNAVKDITDRYEHLLPQTLAHLATASVPTVIENVEGAPLRADVVLCGSMFGLDVMRHRAFQVDGLAMMSPPCNHKGWARRFKSSSGRKNLRYTMEIGAWDEPISEQRRAMGVDADWPITVRELSEGIPPAYTRFVGEQLIRHLAAVPPIPT